jgi:hypothetical protein
MQRIVWHYFCRNQKPETDKYLKYLMISIDSLINTGGVSPKDIFVSLDIPDDLKSVWLDKILSYKINIRKTPQYKNFSKNLSLYYTIKENPNIDKIVQIDCDTFITDNQIISKINELEGAVNHTTMGWPITKVFDSRDGMKHPTFSAEHYKGAGSVHSRNLLFSVSQQPEAKERYASFKTFMEIVFDFDLDEAIDYLRPEERMLVGYLVVFNVQMLSEKYLKFISTLDLFFGCDETILTLARIYSGIPYHDINSKTKIVHRSSSIEDFKKLKGIIHFPVKDDDIQEDINLIANNILLK